MRYIHVLCIGTHSVYTCTCMCSIVLGGNRNHSLCIFCCNMATPFSGKEGSVGPPNKWPGVTGDGSASSFTRPSFLSFDRRFWNHTWITFIVRPVWLAISSLTERLGLGSFSYVAWSTSSCRGLIEVRVFPFLESEEVTCGCEMAEVAATGGIGVKGSCWSASPRNNKKIKIGCSQKFAAD